MNLILRGYLENAWHHETTYWRYKNGQAKEMQLFRYYLATFLMRSLAIFRLLLRTIHWTSIHVFIETADSLPFKTCMLISQLKSNHPFTHNWWSKHCLWLWLKLRKLCSESWANFSNIKSHYYAFFLWFTFWLSNWLLPLCSLTMESLDLNWSIVHLFSSSYSSTFVCVFRGIPKPVLPCKQIHIDTFWREKLPDSKNDMNILLTWIDSLQCSAYCEWNRSRC